MSRNKANVGQFSESVIFAQVAVELKVKRLFYFFLRSEGATEDEAIEAIESTTFSSMVKKQMPSRLGGVWDMTKPGFPINEWYEQCYTIRNYVVHTGYTANKQDAKQAVRTARAFILYIVSLIRMKKKKYPELIAHVEINF